VMSTPHYRRATTGTTLFNCPLWGDEGFFPESTSDSGPAVLLQLGCVERGAPQGEGVRLGDSAEDASQ
jgi:hypothetical protein